MFYNKEIDGDVQGGTAMKQPERILGLLYMSKTFLGEVTNHQCH
jgi:hypothetical protein